MGWGFSKNIDHPHHTHKKCFGGDRGLKNLFWGSRGEVHKNISIPPTVKKNYNVFIIDKVSKSSISVT